MRSVREEWRQVNAKFDGWQYEVSNYGRVRQLATGKIMAEHFSSNGYVVAQMSRSGISKRAVVHRLVLSAFVRPPTDDEEANHIDGNKRNNWVGNLEWVTHSENIRHAIRTGLKLPAKNRWKSRQLTESEVCEIRRSSESTRTAAKTFGVSKNAIWLIRKRKTYRDIA